METSGQKRKTTKVGTVVAKNMSKTVTVQVVRQIRHPLYKKIVRKKRTFLVHDENEKCRLGDVVRIIETRPISKLKRWRVLEIIGLTPAMTASEVVDVIEAAAAAAPEEAPAQEAEPADEDAPAVEDAPEAEGPEGEPR